MRHAHWSDPLQQDTLYDQLLTGQNHGSPRRSADHTTVAPHFLSHRTDSVVSYGAGTETEDEPVSFLRLDFNLIMD